MRRRLVGAGVAAWGLVLLAPLGTASAAVPAADVDGLLVTYVARSCDNYTDVMANKARNNIMESLRDLGQDTVYAPSDPVEATVEDNVPSQRDGCEPLADWRLTLGTGITGKTPGTQNLSTVTGAYPTSIVTRASTPLLDAQGQPTGATLQGAVTVRLTDAQAERAQRGSSLWVQGGTPSQPLNGLQDEYGFAALRCSIDNLNGDNVEWIGFPSGARHVFCYYFAVKPPPTAGTIVVTKQIQAGSNGGQNFVFEGNISYADNDGNGINDFVLRPAGPGSPASISFIRGETRPGEDPWSFAEIVPTGWDLVSATCTSTNGGSVVDSSVGGDPGAFEVTLAAEDTVRCTYVDRQAVTGPLQLSKVTYGDVGSFDFAIDVPNPGSDVTKTVTTTDEGVEVVVASAAAAPAGTYTATETLPASDPTGSWELDGVQCGGVAVPFTSSGRDRTAVKTIGIGESYNCVFSNVFSPAGSLTIRKIAVGDAPGATFGYVIQQYDDGAGTFTGPEFRQSATTDGTDTPATATGADLTALGVDQPDSYYLVTELPPPPTELGEWRFKDVSCTDNFIPLPKAGAALVAIQSDAPDVVCDFTNVFAPYGSLVVTKNAAGDQAGRAGPVTVGLTCDDGTKDSLVLPRTEATASLDKLLFADNASCTVRETETGVADGGTVDTSIGVIVDGDEVDSVDGTALTFDVAAGSEVEVVVYDLYTAPGGVLPSSTALPDTGAPAVGTTATWGFALVLVGFSLLLGVPRRRGSH